MRVSIDVSSLRRTTVFEYAIRFLLGGIITAVTGLIANRFGAAAGGLFLAFPAIFPASVTLVESTKLKKSTLQDCAGRFAAARRRLSMQPAQQSEASDYLVLQSSSDVLLADIASGPLS
jgi:hypothetical protein